ncbi:MAG: methyltransferase [Bacteroidota bacterium]|nr:methyltransferase [Bacteroidota bacterium]
MNTIFLLTSIFVLLTILAESINLFLQLRGRKLTVWFGKNAFKFHILVTGSFWLITFCLIILLQFEKHPLFHHSDILKYIGLILLVSGIILASWGFSLLGLKRSMCLNFFEENVPVVKSSLYKYIENPEDYGLWIALIGLALFTGSLYNLAIALEFIIIMIPHIMLENIPLKK